MARCKINSNGYITLHNFTTNRLYIGWKDDLEYSNSLESGHKVTLCIGVDIVVQNDSNTGEFTVVQSNNYEDETLDPTLPHTTLNIMEREREECR